MASLFDRLETDDDAQPMPHALLRAIAIVPKIDTFFGQYLQSVSFEANAGMPAVMATDCVGTIFYNPDLINKDNGTTTYGHAPFLACVIVHELMHIFRMDWQFLRGREAQLANIALDGVINRDMLAHGYRFPRSDEMGGFRSPYGDGNGFIASTSPGETAVDIYDNLVRAKPDATMPNGGDLDPAVIEQAIADAGGADAVRRMIAQKMAGAQSRAEAIEAGKTNPQKETARDAAKATGAVEYSYGTESSLSDDVLSWSGLKTRRNVNPLANIAGSKLRQGMMSSTRRRVRSLTVPSPMTDLLGYVVAGRKRHNDIRPAFAFDVSGSISVEDVHRAGGEANTWSRGMIGSLAQIPVAFCNTKIIASGSLATYRNAANIPAPHGGTSFIPIFKWAQSLPRKPTHLVIWTDCAGDWPIPATVDKSMRTIVIVPPDQLIGIERYYGYLFRQLGITIITSK